MLSVDTVGEQREAFDDFTDSMEDTLAALPQLQHLLCTFASSGYEVDVPGMPRALTRLHNLQHLWWDIPAVVDLSLPGPSDAWLHGLRRLALTPAAITANGTRLLAATPRLQRLDVLECDAQSDAPLRFAVAHPSVQQVHVSVPTFPSYLARPLGPHEQQLEWARQQRPDVRFTCSRGALFECGPAFDGEEPSLGDELRDSRD